MIKAKVVKIDAGTVYLLNEHGDEVEVEREAIDFGVIEGDSLFLRTEEGRFKFRRVTQEDVEDGAPHYYDADWKKREDEHKSASEKTSEKFDLKEELEKEKKIMINMALCALAVVVVVVAVMAIKGKLGFIIVM